MNYNNQRRAVFFSVTLMLAALAISFALPLTASAATNRMENMPRPHHRTVAFYAENGKVTDSDGIIGNSLYGADARHPHLGKMPARNSGKHVRRGMMGAADQAADGVKRATDGIINGAEQVIDGIGDAARGVTDGLTEGMTGRSTTDGANNGTAANEMDNNTSTDTPAPADNGMLPETQGNRGVIGWVIAILVVIAGALVVLALLPKKQHDRR